MVKFLICATPIQTDKYLVIYIASNEILKKKIIEGNLQDAICEVLNDNINYFTQCKPVGALKLTNDHLYFDGDIDDIKTFFEANNGQFDHIELLNTDTFILSL